jgi:hypothetical protein
VDAATDPIVQRCLAGPLGTVARFTDDEAFVAVGLPRVYAPEVYRQKCSAVFEHVYESYPERNVGVYAGLG